MGWKGEELEKLSPKEGESEVSAYALDGVED